MRKIKCEDCHKRKKAHKYHPSAIRKYKRVKVNTNPCVMRCAKCLNKKAKLSRDRKLLTIPERVVDFTDVGFLYVIRDSKPNSRWFKIGKTIRPIVRLREYNSSFPYDVLDFEYLSCEIFNLSVCERELIKELEYDRSFYCSPQRNEWFENTRERSGRMIATMIKRYEKRNAVNVF